MLGAIKDKDLSIDAHCGDDVGILWLISSLVDFSGMVNLLFNGHLDRSLLAIRRTAVATDFSPLLVVIVRVCCDILWQFNIGDLEVVLGVVGGVRAYEQSVDGVILACRALEIELVYITECRRLTLSYRETIV